MTALFDAYIAVDWSASSVLASERRVLLKGHVKRAHSAGLGAAGAATMESRLPKRQLAEMRGQ